jgi:hypothetical protein
MAFIGWCLDTAKPHLWPLSHLLQCLLHIHGGQLLPSLLLVIPGLLFPGIGALAKNCTIWQQVREPQKLMPIYTQGMKLQTPCHYTACQLHALLPINHGSYIGAVASLLVYNIAYLIKILTSLQSRHFLFLFNLYIV